MGIYNLSLIFFKESIIKKAALLKLNRGRRVGLNAKWILSVLTFALLIGCLLAAGCFGQPGGTQVGPKPVVTTSRSSAGAADYFPMKMGNEWLYNIEIKSSYPLAYEEVFWPQGSGGRTMISRGELYYPAINNNHLRMKIVDRKETPTVSVLLEVSEDDLHMFDYSTGLSWMRLSGDKFGIIQTVTYSTIRPGSPYSGIGMGIGDDGLAQRITFFEDNPGKSLTLNVNQDSLTLIGFDGGVVGCQDVSCMHFRRQVRSESKIVSIVDKGFTEDTWFALGKGMVRLEQKIDGQISMTWTLESFKGA